MVDGREHDLGAMFYALTHEMIRREKPILAEYEITMWEYSVLVALSRDPAARQSELAVRTGRDQTRLIKELDRLQEAALIERAPDPADRRAKVVLISRDGEAVLDAVQERIRAMEDEFLAFLPARERAAFLRTLQTVALRVDRAG